jgi:hypothetical protein
MSLEMKRVHSYLAFIIGSQKQDPGEAEEEDEAI